MTAHRSAPWEKPAPKSSAAKAKLSAADLKWAKARAKKAGRRYPNLVDNMAAARRQKERAAEKADANSHP